MIENIEELDGSLLALEGSRDLRNGMRMRIPLEVCQEGISQATPKPGKRLSSSWMTRKWFEVLRVK